MTRKEQQKKTSAQKLKASMDLKEAVASYVPPIHNPRFTAKSLATYKKAVAFVHSIAGTDKERPLAGDFLNKALPGNSGVAATWLRTKLLTCTDEFFKFLGDASKEERKGYYAVKKYKLNQAGMDEILALIAKYDGEAAKVLNSDHPEEYLRELSLQSVKERFAKEIETGEFQYKFSNHRWWNGMQNMRKEVKEYVFPKIGFTHDYDIKACAPTLIYQHARLLGVEDELPGYDSFLADTKEFRLYVSQMADITKEEAKTVCTALFCGANLGCNNGYQLYKLLGRNNKKMKKLQNDPRIQALVRDIRKCWKAIGAKLPDVEPGKRMRAAQKWDIYFQLEHLVLSTIRKELDKQGVKYFLIHDGFWTKTPIDCAVFEALVDEHTGYKIELVSSVPGVSDVSQPVVVCSVVNRLTSDQVLQESFTNRPHGSSGTIHHDSSESSPSIKVSTSSYHPITTQ